MTQGCARIRLLPLLLVVLSAGPLWAGTEGPPTDSQKIDALQTQMNDVKRSLEDIRRSLSNLETLGRDLRNVQTDTGLALQSIRTLNEQMAQMQRELDALRGRTGASTRISAYQGVGGTARVEMRNSWPQEVTVIVNNRAYRLAPGETRLSDPLPAGAVTYQVLEAQRFLQTRTLAPNETLTVHVHGLP